MGEVFEIAPKGRYGGETVINTFKFISPDMDAAAILNDWQTNLQDAYRAIHPDTYNLDEVHARTIVEEDEFPPATVIVPVDLEGTRSSLGEELAPFLAVRVTLDTGFSGRRFRGHGAYSGGTESDVEGSALRTDSGSWWDKVGDFNGAMLARYGPGGSGPFGLNWVVFSRKIMTSAPTSPSGASNVITGYRVRTTIRTQRSRIRY